jgi:hypothetical protein
VHGFSPACVYTLKNNGNLETAFATFPRLMLMEK